MGAEYEMTEQRTNSQYSLDTDDLDETNFTVTAKPKETARYASQLLGDLPALRGSPASHSMCDNRTVLYPLRLTAANIQAAINAVGANYVSSAPRVPLQRTTLSGSWSSLSDGGSRRIYHRSSHHRSESASSWSSISPGGSRRHRRRSAAIRKTDSPLSPTRDREMPTIKMEQQRLAHAAAPVGSRDQSYDSYFGIQKRDAGGVYASQPKPDSAASSNSSIPSLYGRVVIVGQSPDFRTRIQSFRNMMATPKKQKHSRDKNGYDGDLSDSSISSVASDRLPPAVVKARGGEYATFGNAGETIFEDHPRNKEDTYANCRF